MKNASTAVDSILGENQERLAEELQAARARLSAAEKSAIEQAMHDGWVSAGTASKMIDESDFHSGKPSVAPRKSMVAEQP
jgi:hypothetical protein